MYINQNLQIVGSRIDRVKQTVGQEGSQVDN